MPFYVEYHRDFVPEFDALKEPVKEALVAYIEYLMEIGPILGRPQVDTLTGSTIANLKELRFNADGGVWRVAFAFDERRIAVLLVAGDKRGQSQTRFYKQLIATAEARWATRGGT